jgi:hypothetical protein
VNVAARAYDAWTDQYDERSGTGRLDSRASTNGHARAPLAAAAPERSSVASPIPGRRTITITGRGAAPAYPTTPTTFDRRRPRRPRHERAGFRPDRAALWAVMLCLVLLLVAATSSRAAGRAPTAAQIHRAAPIAISYEFRGAP